MLDCLTDCQDTSPYAHARMSTDQAIAGLLAGTRVATDRGWRPVEALTAGDFVLTFDGGLQPLSDVDRSINWMSDAPCPKNAAPLEVPAGMLGNRETMWLLPDQGVMLESDLAEARTGDPFAVIPAGALVGYLDVKHVEPSSPHQVIRLQFAEDQMVFAGDGALILCSRNVDLVAALLDDSDPTYQVLDREEAADIADDYVAGVEWVA